jgi:alpha-amylase
MRALLKSFRFIGLIALLGSVGSCTRPGNSEKSPEAPFLWENVNVYFLLTDRFHNGNPDNDVNFGRTKQTGVMRGFQGGDLAGVIQKIQEGYFDKLGVTALWMTPWFEQIHGGTDEGTGYTYGYHGYWIKDWTSMDPNFGTPEDLAVLVETAHKHGIRIVMDVIINHTGPVTEEDPVWPETWVRTEPACTYKSYETTISCTLVKNLPDIRTGSNQPVDLPPALLEKWEAEGRLDQEMDELDAFFERTGYPRAPRYYIIKWLTDFVRKYGIDGYRLDTAKHIEEGVWKTLYGEAQNAFMEWKRLHPELVLDNNDFYMVGEVYNYGIGTGRLYDFGDRKVDFYDQSIHSLINFHFKSDAKGDYEDLFSSYSEILSTTLKGKGVLNYLTSHDDGGPYDKGRRKPMEAGTKLLLAPGACQIYYGDESCRNLVIPGAEGDATLRGPMNWDEILQNGSRNGFVIGEVLDHYRKLGRFRREHPAVGAGTHSLISRKPYLFSRVYETGDYSDRVVVGLELRKGKKIIRVGGTFEDGAVLYDYYSGSRAEVKNGRVRIDSADEIVLLGQQ